MDMARLSDTDIVDLSNRSDGVFYSRHIEIEVLHYTAPLIKRMFGLTPSIYQILCAACYTMEQDFSTYIEFDSVYMRRLKCPDFYYSRFRGVKLVNCVPSEHNINRMFQDAKIDGTLALQLKFELKDDTVIPFIHNYPDGTGTCYNFCANNYGRHAVIRYFETEYIHYIQSVQYTLRAEGYVKHGDEVLFDRLVLTPKKHIKIDSESKKASCRTDYPETN